MSLKDDLYVVGEIVGAWESAFPCGKARGDGGVILPGQRVLNIINASTELEKALLDVASYDSGDGVDAFATVIRGARETLKKVRGE